MRMNCIVLIVILCLVYPVSALSATAEMKNIWLEFDVQVDGDKGMNVHCNFTVDNLKDKRGMVAVFITDEDGKWHHVNGNGRTSSNVSYFYESIKPRYNSSVYKDLVIPIKNQDLQLLKGSHSYGVVVVIYDNNRKIILQKEGGSFTGTGSGNNKRRKNYSDGSYEDIETFSDGRIKTTTYRNCYNCHGHTACTICGGAGGRWSGFGNYSNYYLCSSCGGDGKCKFCHGTGKNVTISVYNPQTNSTSMKDLFSGREYNSSTKNTSTNDNTTTTRSSSSTGCSVCHGTGVSPTPSSSMGYATWIAHYNKSGYVCPYCNRADEHWHDKCSRCNAPKY